MLTGSVGTKGGTHPNGWDKFVAHFPHAPEPNESWSEMLWPAEYPLCTNEMSILLPHLLKDGRGKLDVYFSRVYNPIWINPDGFSWIEALTDESKVGLHVALTPTWSESATFADYVLPMGHASERHDTVSMETHASKWLAFRQPVKRVFADQMNQPYVDSRDTNPGQVWEENEFWFELSWRIDPDGSMGIRQWFESQERPGEKMGMEEYYEILFAHSVPGLPEKAAELGMTPLAYMRKYGVFEVAKDVYRVDERVLSDAELQGASVDANGVIRKDGVDEETAVPLVGEAGAIGVRHKDGSITQGWMSPSRKLEVFSTTLADWGWEEHAVPNYFESHVSARQIDRSNSEFVLMPNFRLPTLIHTRSGNAKYLNEISNTHPLWTNAGDAAELGVKTGDLVRVTTEIGHFVARVWATEAIRPGVVGLSHHMGRWMQEGHPGSRWVMGKVKIDQQDTVWNLRYTDGIKPFESADPDSSRIHWDDPGVHQNLTFPVQPDPVSGMHCWHQKVRITKAEAGDEYGDVSVDTAKAREAYRRWMEMTRPGPGPDGQRRPEFLMRHVAPRRKAYRVEADRG